jgi:hypothetical protein
MTYEELWAKMTDCWYAFEAIGEPTATQRTQTLASLATICQSAAESQYTPNPSPQDCAELRRLVDAIQEILRYCPIVNPVPEM